MSVLKVIEVLAHSTQSWEDAAQQAVTEDTKAEYLNSLGVSLRHYQEKHLVPSN